MARLKANEAKICINHGDTFTRKPAFDRADPAHPYWARKFTRYVMHRLILALCNKMKNDRVDGYLPWLCRI